MRPFIALVIGLALGVAGCADQAPKFNDPPVHAQAYVDGQQDHKVSLHLFDAGKPDAYRSGVAWRLNVHGMGGDPACIAKNSDPDFVDGCEATNKLLTTSTDRRRREPDYKAGWDSVIPWQPG